MYLHVVSFRKNNFGNNTKTIFHTKFTNTITNEINFIQEYVATSEE